MSDIQITIYDKDLNPVADLNNAYNIGHEKRLNEVWQVWFELPTTDPHFDEVKGKRFAEIYEDGERVDLFRIEFPEEGHDETSFQCKHVLSTLMDDMLVNTHSGIVGTNSAIDYVLGEQDTAHWQKGTVDFSRSFHHNWTDRTLLYALFSIPDRYNTDYQWTWDTSSYPWTINLIDPSTDVKGLLYYAKNAKEITKEEDYSEIVTKLFAYGNGSGADQVSLSDSSSTSNDYIKDSTAISNYGKITRVWEDQRYTDPDNLYTAAQARLDRKSKPRRVYKTNAVDIYQETGWNQLKVGQYYTIKDDERDIDINVRIERIKKRDITGDPAEVDVELANKRKRYPDFGNVAYADDLDSVKSGSQYAKVYSTQIEAGEILLSAIRGGAAPTMPSTPDTGGLYLGADYMGYHDGSNWITYMDSSGHLRLDKPSTGAQVELLPDANEGLQVLDNDGNQVLAALVAGTDVGDVIIGDEVGGSYAKYDKSAGSFIVRGSLTADDLNGGTLDFSAISRTGLSVIESEISNNAVTKDKISVTKLSAISGDFGVIESGYASFAGGDVQIGDNVTSDDSDGIYVTKGGKVELEDTRGMTLFNSDGEFEGIKIIDAHVSTSSGDYQGDQRGDFGLDRKGWIQVWSNKSVTIPPGTQLTAGIIQAVGNTKPPNSGSEQGSWEGVSSNGGDVKFVGSGGTEHFRLFNDGSTAESYTLDLYGSTVNSILAGISSNDYHVWGGFVMLVFLMPYNP